MRCVFCKIGETAPQRVTAEHYNERGELVALIQNVPAEVCAHCGEEYYQAEHWAKVEKLLADGEPPTKVTEIPVYAMTA